MATTFQRTLGLVIGIVAGASLAAAAPAAAAIDGALVGVVHLKGSGDLPLRDRVWSRVITGQLEGFSVQLARPDARLSLEYMCHLEGIGDVPYMPAGSFCGTRGESRRLEGFAVRLTGSQAGAFDVHYLCHTEGGDWGPVKNGELCGTRGQSIRLEGLYMWVSPRF